MAAKRCQNASYLEAESIKVAGQEGPDRSKLSLKKSRFVQPLAEVDMNSLCEQFVPVAGPLIYKMIFIAKTQDINDIHALTAALITHE
jgi:hypothetical protein